MLVQAARTEQQSGQQSTVRRPPAGATTAKPGLFAEMLALSKSTEVRRKTKTPREQLDDLLADLDAAEQRFATSPDRREFEQYRATIRKLTSFLLQNGHKFQQLQSKQGTKVHEIVRIIDQKMSQLLHNFLRRRNDVVIALHVMGEIRGLVVDVFS